VPEHEQEQITCYRSYLPVEIMKLLRIQDSTAERQIYRILNEKDIKLEEIMMNEDIRDALWLEQPPPPTLSAISTFEGPELAQQDFSGPSALMIDSSQPPELDEEQPAIGSFVTQTSRNLQRVSILTPSNLFRENTQYDEDSYRWLLRRVVGQARRAGSLNAPESVAASLESIDGQLAEMDLTTSNALAPSFFAIFGDNANLRIKMGAAGELFVSRPRSSLIPKARKRVLTLHRSSNISVQTPYLDLALGIGRAGLGPRREFCRNTQTSEHGRGAKFLTSCSRTGQMQWRPC